MGLGDARALGDEGDRRSHDLIVAALREARPGDAVLLRGGGRHAPVGPAGRGSRVWIVDPLDGTREFGEGRADFAVHVALVVDGAPSSGRWPCPARPRPRRPATPALRPAPGAAAEGPLRDRREPHPAAGRGPHVAARLGAELVPMGSAGAKTMAVVRGEVDVYVHSGGQYEWDSAAPVAVALAAGIHADAPRRLPPRLRPARPLAARSARVPARVADAILAALG